MVGSDLDDAFRIGEEIAEMVTSAMKPPMKLQLEKVYLPCMLFAKKRYAGEYERETQSRVRSERYRDRASRWMCVVRRILKHVDGTFYVWFEGE